MSKVRIPEQALDSVIDWSKYKKLSAERLKDTVNSLFQPDIRSALESRISSYHLLKETISSYHGLLAGLGNRLYYLPIMDFSDRVSLEDFVLIEEFTAGILSIMEIDDELVIVIDKAEENRIFLKKRNLMKPLFPVKSTHLNRSRTGAIIISGGLEIDSKLMECFNAILKEGHDLHSVMTVGEEIYLHIIQDDLHSLIVKTRSPDFVLNNRVMAYYPPALEPAETRAQSLKESIRLTNTLYTSHGFLSTVNIKRISLNYSVISGTELGPREERYATSCLLSELPLRFLVSIPNAGEIRLYTVDHLSLEVIDCATLKIPTDEAKLTAICPVKADSNHTWLLDRLL